jgi:hypothetical protein
MKKKRSHLKKCQQIKTNVKEAFVREAGWGWQFVLKLDQEKLDKSLRPVKVIINIPVYAGWADFVLAVRRAEFKA